MKADELWEKYSQHVDLYEDEKPYRLMNNADFLAALQEYGEAVRKRDAEICREFFTEWSKSPPLTVTCPTVNDCAAAISREPLP